MPEPRYLGDAVYAQVDTAGQLVLTTDSHILGDASNVIFLEPSVVDALIKYYKEWRPENEN